MWLHPTVAYTRRRWHDLHISPSSLSCTTQARIDILDHETRFQPRYFADQTSQLHAERLTDLAGLPP